MSNSVENAMAYLKSILAPREIVHKQTGITEKVSPSFIGPLKRKDIEVVLAAMVEQEEWREIVENQYVALGMSLENSEVEE